MVYPIDNNFTRQQLLPVYRCYRLFIVFCILIMAMAGVCTAYRCMPSVYRVSGVILLEDFSDNSAENKLQNSFRAALVFADQKHYEALDWLIVPQFVDGSAVAHWQIDFPNVQSSGAFLRKMPEFIRRFQSFFPEKHAAFSAVGKPVRHRDFTAVWLYCAAGAASGMLAGFLLGVGAVFLKSSCNRSIGDLQQFSKQHNLPILGVLPKSDNNIYFDEAIKSLQLKIQFCKPAAARAFVLVISDFIPDSGAESVAALLTDSLKSAGFRVLLLSESNCNMSAAQGLSHDMESLLARQSPCYDFIIINVPDIQSSSVPMIIGKLADSVLIVCNYNCCPGYPLQVVLWRLNKAKVNVAGCVINNFPLHKKHKQYNLYRMLFRSYRS